MKARIFDFVRGRGPSIPKDVSKEFKIDTTFAGAYLSELVSNKKILVSNTKIGGSPVYYAPEHKEKLQDLYTYLNEKDKKTYDLLKQSKILRDKEQTPLVRASLRLIKDFAIPLQVNVQPAPELFWKWYLVTKEDAELIIKAQLEIKKQEPAKEELKNEIEKPAEQNPSQLIPVKEKEPAKANEEKKAEPIYERKKDAIGGQTEVKICLTEKKQKKTPEPDNEFLAIVTKYFMSNKIEVIQSEIVKKTELDYTVRIPSVVGMLEYYCKARKKKKFNEGDLSSAFVTGQAKKLPILFLATGDPTKRANEMLSKEFKNHLVFKKI